jgi:CxxC motif-containing protein (DUF1111 family)
MTEVRAGYRDADGKFSAMNGGTLYHLFSTPPHRCQAQIPIEANVIARRAPIPLFGAGLIETIDDATLLALEDPDDRDNDGVRGRAARIIDIATRGERIGRFGWKAQHATLLSFSGDAYRNEMGITNDLFPTEDVLGFTPEQLKLCGAKGNIEDARDDDSVRAGETLFTSVGCATCHTPVLMTGQNANPSFNRKPVALFSDLLLHDVGTGDGIEQSAAGANEIRTPALWGLRFRRPLLHDGTAATPEDAIRRHSQEAAGSVERFEALPRPIQEQLLAFLNSL